MTQQLELKKEENNKLIKYKNIKLTNKINESQEKTSKKAFSLLELLVVILILGILAATVVPNLVGAGDKAKVDLMCPNMKTISRIIDNFKMDNGMYPETEEGFNALIKNPDSDKYTQYSSAGYMKKIPKDSWGKEMTYIKVGNGFDIISYGADKKEGGSEEYADIKFSSCE